MKDFKFCRLYAFFVFFLTLAGLPLQSAEVKIADLVHFYDGRMNQVTGFGLVIGLNNTGDMRSPFTEQALSNYLNSLGVDTKIRPKETRNIASVMITANIPSWLKPGDRFDVLVSSIGDARSLEGGVLIQSPLKAANGEIVAVASGSLQESEAKDSQRIYSRKKKVSNTAVILNGGILEKGLQLPIYPEKTESQKELSESDSSESNEVRIVRFVLKQPNTDAMNAILEAIGSQYSDIKINVLNTREMELILPEERNLIAFLSEVGKLKLDLETPSKIIINQKTGTIVMGGNLVMDEVAVSKSGLKLQVESRGKSRYFWSEFEDKSESVFYIKKINNVKSLVDELNRIGARTEDVISILQGLNRSGILHAEVIVE